MIVGNWADLLFLEERTGDGTGEIEGGVARATLGFMEMGERGGREVMRVWMMMACFLVVRYVFWVTIRFDIRAKQWF